MLSALALSLVVVAPLWAQSPAPSTPTPAAVPVKKGRIAGTVLDRKTGESIIGAAVKVEGVAKGAITDLDGKFVLPLEPGTYSVSISYIGYNTQKFDNVKVTSGQITNLDAGLSENVAALTKEVVITTVVKRGSVDALLLNQKSADAVSSGISSELIRRTPDRTAADVLKRVSGTTIQDNKFAIVRGLGDRYNYGMVNGAPLASTEADRKAFNLEMIPATMIESIVVTKSATPDQPGDFGGGIVTINTKDVPVSNQYYVQIGGGSHSLTTGKSFNAPNQTAENLPSGLISQEQANALWQAGGSSFSRNAPFVENTRLFTSDLGFKSITAPINRSAQLGIGQRIELSEGNDLGIVAAGSFGQSFRNAPVSTLVVEGIPNDSNLRFLNSVSTDFMNSKRNTMISGVLNATLKLKNGIKVYSKNFVTQSNDQITTTQRGLRKNEFITDQGWSDSSRFTNTFLLEERNRLMSSQLGIEGNTQGVKPFKYKLVLGSNQLYRNTPDFRRFLYRNTVYQFGNPQRDSGVFVGEIANSFDPNRSNRFFSELNESAYSVNLALDQALLTGKTKLNVKAGGMYQTRNRDFTARNFVFAADLENLSRRDLFRLQRIPADSILLPGNVDTNKLFLREATQPSDAYTASSKLVAGYGLLDFRVDKWHVIGGMRMEQWNLKLNSNSSSGRVNLDTTVVDFLPSLNVIFEATEKMNVRASVTRTVSRPEFREFAPLAFFDVNFNSIVVGNPDLKRASLLNFDAKFEYFPTDGELISINPFFKSFENPIEQTVEIRGGYRFLGYANAPRANNFGVELELRKNLGAEGTFFGDFTAFGNYTWIRSRVSFDGATNVVGDFSRPLQGQSPYIVNLGLQYSNQPSGINALVTVNRIGRRIVFLAPAQDLVLWENPRTVVDFSLSKTFFKKLNTRLTVGDLLAQKLVYYQDTNLSGKLDGNDIRAFVFRYGFTTSLSLNYTF